MEITCKMLFSDAEGYTVPNRADIVVVLPEGTFTAYCPGEDPAVINEIPISLIEDDEVRERVKNMVEFVCERFHFDTKAFAVRHRRQWGLKKKSGRDPGTILFEEEKGIIARIVRDADRPLSVADVGRLLTRSNIDLSWQTVKKYLNALEEDGEVGKFQAGKYYLYTRPGYNLYKSLE